MYVFSSFKAPTGYKTYSLATQKMKKFCTIANGNFSLLFRRTYNQRTPLIKGSLQKESESVTEFDVLKLPNRSEHKLF